MLPQLLENCCEVGDQVVDFLRLYHDVIDVGLDQLADEIAKDTLHASLESGASIL